MPIAVSILVILPVIGVAVSLALDGDSDTSIQTAFVVWLVATAFSWVFGYFLQRVRRAEAIRIYLAMLRHTYRENAANSQGLSETS